MADPPERPGTLEMQKPGLPARQLHQRTLMRTVYRCSSLMEHHFPFERPIQAAGA
ncbi:hypothetical protein D3C75_1092290 [compost metagenome]